MVGILLGVNITLGVITVFATSMIQNHFKKIDRSIQIYTDKKVYKSKSDIYFLASLLEKYKLISQYNKHDVDIMVMVTKTFYEEQIGRFKYTKVQSIATKGKVIMWGVLASQMGVQLLRGTITYSEISFIMIIANSIICMLVALVGVIKSIPEEREKLFIKLEDYIVNIYPAEIEWQDNKNNIKELEIKLRELEEELDTYKAKAYKNDIIIEVNKQETSEEVLHERDIIHLLDKIKLNI